MLYCWCPAQCCVRGISRPTQQHKTRVLPAACLLVQQQLHANKPLRSKAPDMAGWQQGCSLQACTCRLSTTELTTTHAIRAPSSSSRPHAAGPVVVGVATTLANKQHQHTTKNDIPIGVAAGAACTMLHVSHYSPPLLTMTLIVHHTQRPRSTQTETTKHTQRTCTDAA